MTPRGIEILVKKASVDGAFRRYLLAERSGAAERIGLALDPAETEMLDAIPEAQLLAIIGSTRINPLLRPAFMGYAAAAMLAVAGGMVGCGDGKEGSNNEEDKEYKVKYLHEAEIPGKRPPGFGSAGGLGIRPDGEVTYTRSIRSGLLSVKGPGRKDRLRSINALEEIINTRQSSIEWQMLKYLHDEPELEGSFTTSFMISPTGELCDVSIKEADYRDIALGVEIIKTMEKWSFPNITKGEVTVECMFIYERPKR